MKRLTVSLLLISSNLFFITSINAQWFEKSNGLPQNWYTQEIDAYDSLIATGPQTVSSIYITTDGGNNWYSRPKPTWFYHFSIIGSDKIWITNSQEIYATTDGGFNWQLQFYDTSKTKYINYLEMFDSLNGIAMGDAASTNKPALILKTTNGGVNWISQNDSNLIGLLSSDYWVDFANPDVGYVCGYDYINWTDKLYKTEDGGKDWKFMFDAWVFPSAYDSNIALCYSCTGKIYRTTDRGSSWELFNTPATFRPAYPVFIPGNPSNVWHWSGGDLLFSSDTGRTWKVDCNTYLKYIKGIEFTDENCGWMVGRDSSDNYRIFRTTNGGHGGIVSVNDNRSNSIISDFILEQNYPNPFNPSTKIKYSIPQSSSVVIKVFDVLGNEIETLVNEEKQTGTYEITWYAENLPSGIYFIRLQAGSFVETKKMILLK